MADNMSIFMHAERIQESGDDYTSINSSGHTGAYQFDMATWIYALRLAGLQYVVFGATIPALAPSGIQDAAARALMSKYYGEFGNSFYNVAEAWYGGPGAVGHPGIGGGPGYPTVGEYASQVIAIYNRLGGTDSGEPLDAVNITATKAATLAELTAAVNAEAKARAEGDSHSREQAAAGIADEAIARSTGDAHTRQQLAAAIKQEIADRTAGDDHTRQQLAAAIKQEIADRTAGDDHTRQQLAAAISAEVAARTAGDDHTRQQLAAAIKALSDTLTRQIDSVLKYAQSLPGLVDQRAAAGYDPTLAARATLLGKLLDTAAAHEPLIAGLVSRLATAVVDLAGVEDPILRVAMQLILKQVIDRLGINTALGAMLSDLVGGIFGGGQPKTLQAVTADIGKRLNALENGQAELSPLAPEADNLHEMGTLIFDAALLSYFTAAVVSPAATANDTVTALGPVTSPLLAPVRALLGM